MAIFQYRWDRKVAHANSYSQFPLVGFAIGKQGDVWVHAWLGGSTIVDNRVIVPPLTSSRLRCPCWVSPGTLFAIIVKQQPQRELL